MTSLEERERRRKRRQRNLYAKELSQKQFRQRIVKTSDREKKLTIRDTFEEFDE